MQLFAIMLVVALSSHIYRLFFQDGCSPTWSFRSSNGAPIATIIQYLYLAAVLPLLFPPTFLSIAHPWRELDLHIRCAKYDNLSLILWALGENFGLFCSICCPWYCWAFSPLLPYCITGNTICCTNLIFVGIGTSLHLNIFSQVFMDTQPSASLWYSWFLHYQ